MIKRFIILILVISGIFFFWKSQKDETVQPKQEHTETETSEKNEDPKTDTEEVEPEEVEDETEENSTTSLLDKLKKNSEAKKEENPDSEPEEKKEIVEKREIIETSSSKSTSSETNKKESTTHPPVNPTPPVSSPSAAIPSRETKVKVYLYEWAIDLSQKAIPSGTVVFEVHNTGKFTHDFMIRGIETFEKVRPNETRVFTARLKNGKYTLLSERGKDKEKNMTEDFVVFE